MVKSIACGNFRGKTWILYTTKEIYLEKLQQAIQFVEQNLDKKITLKEVASAAQLSEFHFHRIFHSLQGETVKEFILRLKIERAANQLKHSGDDIGTIAWSAGYENHESFTRAFKKYFGSTPQAYRESINAFVQSKRVAFQKQGIIANELGIGEPHLKHLPDLHLAYIRHTGSYDQVGPSFQRLMIWAATHFVLKLKPTTLGIVHDDPDLTEPEKIRFDAAVLVNKEIQPRAEIAYKKIPGGKFAVYRYKGPYEGFYEVYNYVYNISIFEKGWELDDKPSIEWYIKSPPFYKPANYLTDFYVPIK